MSGRLAGSFLFTGCHASCQPTKIKGKEDKLKKIKHPVKTMMMMTWLVAGDESARL
jgi:hypothetical protein